MFSTILFSTAASLLALSNPASTSPTPLLSLRQSTDNTDLNTTQQLNSMTRFFFTNCWANSSSSGGSLSEIDWFFEYPTPFGSAVPNLTTTMSENNNTVWEAGGNANVTNGNGYADFAWYMDNDVASAAPAGKEVGNADATAPVLQQTISVPSLRYTIVKQSGEEVLYSKDGLDCRVFYEGIVLGDSEI